MKWMRSCLITDVVYRKMMRSLENYERNTGKRHPLQSEVVPSVKREVGNVTLTDVKYADETLWFGTFSRLRYLSCLKRSL
jgi:hypothetical protein